MENTENSQFSVFYLCVQLAGLTEIIASQSSMAKVEDSEEISVEKM